MSKLIMEMRKRNIIKLKYSNKPPLSMFPNKYFQIIVAPKIDSPDKYTKTLDTKYNLFNVLNINHISKLLLSIGTVLESRLSLLTDFFLINHYLN